MAEPLDTGDVKIFLQFDENAKVQIAEPIRFDAANFVLQQKDKRLGRDISFASGEIKLRFDPIQNFRGLTHQFTKLVTYYRTKGQEAKVKYIIQVYGQDYVIGILDFKTAETDFINYFDCTVIQDSNESTVKNLENIKVDLFSDKNVDGDPIVPLSPDLLFLRATPITQESEWEGAENYYRAQIVNGGNFFYDFFPYPVIKKSAIEETYSPPLNSLGERDDFFVIEAENQLTNLTIEITGLNYKLEVDTELDQCLAYGRFSWYIGTESTGNNNLITEIFETPNVNRANPSFEIVNGNYVFENLTLERGEKLFMWFETNILSADELLTVQTRVTGGTVNIKAISTSVSSVITCFNLGDAMAQVVKSISGLEIDAPRFTDANGEFKKQYITNGSLIRNITSEPFYLSLSEIEEQLNEWRADYEVQDNGKVFFGIWDDFYRSVKIGTLTNRTNEEFKSTLNPEYTTNVLEMEFSKYSNDNEEDGSRDAVHCKLQALLPNKGAINTKPVKIGFIRDSFIIENTRKKAITTNEGTVTENDNSVVIIDAINKNLQVDEVLVLRHLASSDGDLKLLNNGTFNWQFAGLLPNDFIQLYGENEGDWLVVGVEPNVLSLVQVTAPADFSGETVTRIVFNVTATTLTNRTDEGFDIIAGLNNKSFISNLNFTLKRILVDYYAKYLLTACTFNTNDIRVTEYLYNRELRTQRAGENELLKEGDVVDLADLAANGLSPVTPFLYEAKVKSDFTTFWAIKTKARKERGYIEVLDSEDVVVGIYPKKLTFNWGENTINIIGELKR